MTVFALKILAMASMICDHLGWFLYLDGHIDYGLCTAMRSFGRLAFPIFAFLIANGYRHSRDRAKYLTRLCAFALVSQLPFVMVFTAGNYYAPLYGGLSFSAPAPGYISLAVLLGILWYKYLRADMSALLPTAALLLGLCTLKLGGFYLLRPDMNVFYTLAFSLAAICVLDRFRHGARPISRDFALAAALLAALVLIWDRADYGINGILLIVLLHLFEGSRFRQAAMLLIWCLLQYPPGSANTGYFICAALSLLPVLLYNGLAGKNMKTAFYLVYPLHLSALAILTLC